MKRSAILVGRSASRVYSKNFQNESFNLIRMQPTTQSQTNTCIINQYKSILQQQQQDVNQIITTIGKRVNTRVGGGSSKDEIKIVKDFNSAVPSKVLVVEGENNFIGFQMMNRNARKPNKANHGKRPCSRIARRAKRSRYGNPRRK